MNQNKATAYLQQLCYLGLEKEAIISEFLRAVSTLLPSTNNTFVGFDEYINPTYCLLGFDISPDLEELGSRLITHTFTLRCRQYLASWFKNQTTLLRDSQALIEAYYQSDLHSLICRHSDPYHRLSLPVVQSCTLIGMINLFRPLTQKPFTSYEQDLLISLLPSLSRALTAPNAQNVQYTQESTATGLIIMDTQGHVQHISHEVQNLLLMMCHPVLSTDTCNYSAVLLQKLAVLTRNLMRLFEDKNTISPQWSYINQRGYFNCRAFYLDGVATEPRGLVGLSIQHHEPITLKILRTSQNLPLTFAQKQIIILVAQGLSNERITDHLHIKHSTLKDHFRKVFAKLDIHNRDELVPLLLTLKDKTPASVAPLDITTLINNHSRK